MKLLIFGYGNPSRGDDALGPELVTRLNDAAAQHPEWPEVVLLTDFQLQVEHAIDLKGCDLALFVDASVSGAAPYTFARLVPAQDATYTTHAMSPAAVMEVYREIHGEEPPPCFLLAIWGERFELGEPLSSAAKAHLQSALTLVERLCAEPNENAWQKLVADTWGAQRAPEIQHGRAG